MAAPSACCYRPTVSRPNLVVAPRLAPGFVSGSGRLAAVAAALLFVLMGGCARKIGDKCSISTDCSVNGDRICDTAQPGGYCTVQGCDPDSCPDGAVCVEWRFEPSRTTSTYCMERCRGGCSRGGYECVADDDPRLESGGTSLARVTDLGGRRDAKFCAAVAGVTAASSMSLVPTQSSPFDASVPQ